MCRWFCLCRHLEKYLPYLVLSTSAAYDKWNMFIYNLGFHGLGTRADMRLLLFAGHKRLVPALSNILNQELYHQSTISCTRGQSKIVAWNYHCAWWSSYRAITTVRKSLIISPSWVATLTFQIAHNSDQSNYMQRIDWFILLITGRVLFKRWFMLPTRRRDVFKSVANLEHCITRRKESENNSPVNWLKIP